MSGALERLRPPAGGTPPPDGMAGRADAIGRLLRRVRALELHANRLLDGGLAGAYRSVFRGRGIEAEGLREYTLDDDAALIDWQASARTPRPCLRVFREERELVCLLVVDVSPSMACPVHGVAPRETAAEAAALLAAAATRNRDRVGLLLFSSSVELWLPPGGSRGQTLRIVREVLFREPAGRGTSLGAGLQAAARAMPGRGLVFLVSDLLCPLPESDLARLCRRHEVTILRVAHPDPLWASLPGPVWLEDAETGQCRAVCPGSAAVAEWLRRSASRDQTLRRTAHACGAQWVELPCGPGAVPALVRYLRRRAGERRVAAREELPG